MTEPTLEEQIEWANALIGCDSAIAPAVLKSLLELAAIKIQPVPVEPDAIAQIRKSTDPTYFQEVALLYIDSLQQQLQVAQQERDEYKRQSDFWKKSPEEWKASRERFEQRAEKAESENAELRRDAERYRWLSDKIPADIYYEIGIELETGEQVELDEAIDRARSE